MRPKNTDSQFALGDRLIKTAATSRMMWVNPTPPTNARLARAFYCTSQIFVAHIDHTIRRIAQEWQTFKLRLDSRYPETRGTDGYLGGLVESQRCVLDATVQEAVSLLPSPAADK